MATCLPSGAPTVWWKFHLCEKKGCNLLPVFRNLWARKNLLEVLWNNRFAGLRDDEGDGVVGHPELILQRHVAVSCCQEPKRDGKPSCRRCPASGFLPWPSEATHCACPHPSIGVAETSCIFLWQFHKQVLILAVSGSSDEPGIGPQGSPPLLFLPPLLALQQLVYRKISMCCFALQLTAATVGPSEWRLKYGPSFGCPPGMCTELGMTGVRCGIPKCIAPWGVIHILRDTCVAHYLAISRTMLALVAYAWHRIGIRDHGFAQIMTVANGTSVVARV